MRSGHPRYQEVWLRWTIEPVMAVIVVPVQAAAWWLTRSSTHAELSDLAALVIAAWLLSAPIGIATRELIGKPTGADGEYSNPHWMTAEVTGRTVASVLAFLWISANPLAGILIGTVTGLIAAAGVVLFNQPWKPLPQPNRGGDGGD